MSLRHAMFLFLVFFLMMFLIKESRAYDLVCDVVGTQDVIVISSDRRSYMDSSRLEDGRSRFIRIHDMILPDELNDYVKYKKGRYTITYILRCHKL